MEDGSFFQAMTVIVCGLALALFPALLPSGTSRARDLNGQWADSPNKAWFARQKNQNNVLCCDAADGKRLEDADWKADEQGHYWVRLEGEWKQVPDSAVITPKDRPVDYAVVWIFMGQIFCFMAGAGA